MPMLQQARTHSLGLLYKAPIYKESLGSPYKSKD